MVISWPTRWPKAGVDVSPLRVFATEARTALAFVSLRADGEREFMFYRHPSADMLFTPREVDVDVINRAKLLHFGSISLIGEPSRGATLYAVDTARAAGCLISYDPNLRLPLWPDANAARDGMLLGLKKAHIVKLSDDESEFLTGISNLENACKALWHDELKLMVVTRGRAGCVYFTPGFLRHSRELHRSRRSTRPARAMASWLVCCKDCSPIRPRSRMKRACANCAASPTRSGRSLPWSGARFRRCRTANGCWISYATGDCPRQHNLLFHPGKM